MATRSTKKGDSTATIGFEAKLWLAADKLRKNMDAAAYKHVVLGRIVDDAMVAIYGQESNATTRRRVQPAWYWPMAACPPSGPAKATSVAPSSRPTSWTAWKKLTWREPT